MMSSHDKDKGSTRGLIEIFKYIKKYRYELIAGVLALIVTDAIGLLPPWLIKLAIDYVNIENPPFTSMNPLIKYSLFIVTAVGLQAIFRYYWRKHLFGISRKIEYDLRNDYFKHLQELHWGFFQHTKTGDIMSRATNDLQAVREFLGLGSVIIVDTSVIISACIILMIVISPRLAIISLLPMLSISIMVLKFSKEIKRRFESVQSQLSAISSMVQESIAGIRVVQAYVQEGNELNRFKRLNQELVDKNLGLTRISGIFFPLMVFITGLATVLVLWVGGREVIAGRLTVGSYVAFSGYLAMLTWPMAGIGIMINLTQRGIASIERIEAIMKVKTDIYDRPETIVKPAPAINGDIEFRSLTFSYNGKDAILFNINLNIKTWSSVAIVGAVGSGKSTLVRLIPRIYDVPGDSVFIDNVDIKKIPLKILREGIGYVDQEPFLFSDTIRENIAFGVKNVTAYDVEKAVILAGLDRDLEIMPEGLDTIIGERGLTLSGGQRQRVALARAIIKKPKILILDDAFSNLDAETEERVFKHLKEWREDTTIILTSHRISTIKEADMIVAIENGKIAEIGTHDELISKDGFYQRIYKKHFFAGMEMLEE